MDNRKELRPVLAKIEATEKCSIEEKFQNTTLRQVIKLQHPLLIALFQDYAITRKTVLNTLTEQRIKRFIESALSKDIAFKNKIIGLILGQFTLEEFMLYNKTDKGKGLRESETYCYVNDGSNQIKIARPSNSTPGAFVFRNLTETAGGEENRNPFCYKDLMGNAYRKTTGRSQGK